MLFARIKPDRAGRRAADFCRQFDLRKADGIELGTAHAEIAQAEGDIRLFRIDFSEKPDESAFRHEQFHHRKEVRLVFSAAKLLHEPSVPAENAKENTDRDKSGGRGDGGGHRRSRSCSSGRGGRRRWVITAMATIIVMADDDDPPDLADPGHDAAPCP
jgi:hypothetical protein